MGPGGSCYLFSDSRNAVILRELDRRVITDVRAEALTHEVGALGHGTSHMI